MNYLLIALHCLLPYSGDTSAVPFPYSIKPAPVSFSWPQYELSLPKPYKDSVLASMKKVYAKYFGDKNYCNTAAFISSFHFVQLNGDQLPDLVYTGWSGSEGTMVQFYVNRGKQLEEIFTDHTVPGRCHGQRMVAGRNGTLPGFFFHPFL